jgi:glycosyltransferase involved in cell wall biosynthesis
VAGWVDEIVVVDMESSDRTAEIARSFGARVVAHAPLMYADPARAFAVQQATGEWIMMLDADELVTPSLAKRLMTIAESGSYDVVQIPWLNYLLGAPLQHSGWGPTQDRHPRFFRRHAMDLPGDIHAFLRPTPSARVLVLPYDGHTCVVHFNYVDVSHFLEKLNRYTDVEAEAALQSGSSGAPVRAVLSAVREFGRRFTVQGGWRDGWRGFYLAVLMAGYRLVTHAKIKERRENGGRDDVWAAYEREAERWLNGA